LITFHYRSYGTFFLQQNWLHNSYGGFTHYRNYRAEFLQDVFSILIDHLHDRRYLVAGQFAVGQVTGTVAVIGRAVVGFQAVEYVVGKAVARTVFIGDG